MRRTLLALAATATVLSLAPAASANHDPLFCTPPLHLDDPGYCFYLPHIQRDQICTPPLHLDDPGFCI